MSKRINMEAGRPSREKKRRKHYRRLLKYADEAFRLLEEETGCIDEQLEAVNMKPSAYERALKAVALIKEDLSYLAQVFDNCDRRINHHEQVASGDKILSISDVNAAYIQKGNREATVGYKPQVGKSKRAFIGTLLVPVGNAADSGQLEIAIEDNISRTGVLPATISTDDGYVNRAVREKYLRLGTSVFSFGGSKGKRLLSDEEWEDEAYIRARNDRSSVESLMFAIKYGFNFGRVVRRGIDNVRAELIEKVLAYNGCRAIEIRNRQKENQLPKVA